MKKIFKYILAAAGIALIPALAYAVQVTIPSATQYGQVPVGQSTGNYIPMATSTLFQNASASNTGLLTSGDWTTFNGKGTGNGTVTSVDGSGGTTGLTVTGGPVTTTGTLTLGGTLNIANGGLGFGTVPSYGQMLVGNGTNYTLTATSSLGIGTTKTVIWIDSNRTDSYTADGSIFRPFKTITLANAGVAAAGYASAYYSIAPGTYSEQSMTLPNIPLVISGQGATVILLSGASVGAGTVTIPNDISWYDAVIFGNVLETDTSQTNPHTFTNGFVAGNFSVKGNATFTGGAIVDQNTIAFPFLSQSASSTVTVQANSITNFTGDNIQAVVNNSGTLNLDDDNLQVSTSTTYALNSTSGGSVDIVGLSLENFGTGGGMNLQNGATNPNGNFLSSLGLTLGAGTVNAINAGTAVSYVGPYTAYTVTGTRLYATGSGLSQSSFATLGVEGNVSLNVNGGLTGINATSTPWGNLSVAGSSAQAIPLIAVSTSTASFATSTAFVIDQNGKVGIGTSTPGTTLSINSIANFQSGTSTLYGGLNLTGGCFSVSGICIGGSGGGAVTSVSNSDGTLTISPTAGAVVSSLALGHANAWTGQQLFDSTLNQGFATSTPWGVLSVGTYNLPIATPSFVIGSSSAALGTSTDYMIKNGSVFLKNSIFSRTAQIEFANQASGTWLDFPNSNQSYAVTAGTDQMIFSDDSETGTYVFRTPSKNLLNLVAATGNAGIGSSTPWARLSVGSNSNSQVPLFAIGSSTASGGTTTAFMVSANGTVQVNQLARAAGTFVAADPSGNLIATTTPAGGSGVTSVGLSLPTGFAVTGSPVTTTGTLTAALSSNAFNLLRLPSFIVAASGGDFTTIQAALTACGTAGGGNIYLTDTTYAQAGTGLTWRGGNCSLWGRGSGTTTITFTGATTLFKTNSAAGQYAGDEIHNLEITADGNASGVAIDWSDMTHGIVDDVQTSAVGTSLRLNDTQNITFYNSFTNLNFNDNRAFCVNASSTNPVNANTFHNIFCGDAATSNVIGFQMNNANGNDTSMLFLEPGTLTGTVGLKIFDNTLASNNGVFNNTFSNVYAEANGTGISVATAVGPGGGIQRNKFLNISSESNTTDWSVTNAAQALNTFDGYDSNFGKPITSLQGPIGISTSTQMQNINATPYAFLAVNPTAGVASNQFVVGSSTKTALRIDNSGAIFAPSTASSGSSQTGYWCYDASGQLIRDSAVCLVSALKFKKDVSGLTVGLDDLMRMRPVSYYKKDPLDEQDSHMQMGFIADEVASTSPALNEMLVTYDDAGAVHGFRYEQFTALLAKSIQQLNEKVDAKAAQAKRSVEEDWQWAAMGLLALGIGLQQRQIRKIRNGR